VLARAIPRGLSIGIEEHLKSITLFCSQLSLLVVTHQHRPLAGSLTIQAGYSVNLALSTHFSVSTFLHLNVSNRPTTIA
jgi:hypothetical protein